MPFGWQHFPSGGAKISNPFASAHVGFLYILSKKADAWGDFLEPLRRQRLMPMSLRTDGNGGPGGMSVSSGTKKRISSLKAHGGLEALNKLGP
jgi:hypothetical protein